MIEIIFLIFFILCCLGIYLRERNINKQKQEIKKYKNVVEYIIANKDNILLTKMCSDFIYFELEYINIEIYLYSDKIKINNIKYRDKKLATILKEIYYKDRDNLLF